MMHRLKKGLNIPISGKPTLQIDQGASPRTVGILGNDYIGMKPSMLVKEGQNVKIGEPLFHCKKNEGLVFTSPAAGKVTAISRGEKRVFQSIEIQVSNSEDFHSFSSFRSSGIDSRSVDEIRELLVESGLWTCIRERPFDKTAPVKGDLPDGIFVSVMDTQPLSVSPQFVIQENLNLFQDGLRCLAKLTQGKLFVCADNEWSLELPDEKNIQLERFEGPHPAGNVGTHMHFLMPPNSGCRIWHVGYQDVVAIGALFASGKLFTKRYVALGGPRCRSPRVLETRLGANLKDLTSGEFDGDESSLRLMSGSVLHGQLVSEPTDFLGRYHNQVSVLGEGKERHFMGWHAPGVNQFSAKPIFVSRLLPKKLFDLTTSTHGSSRSLVPFGLYEKVCPLDTHATPLLKALLSKDTDTAQELGVLELAEEDVSLFTFVCTGKTDYGPILRENLELIEKEG